jgi:hypothetical protein
MQRSPFELAESRCLSFWTKSWATTPLASVNVSIALLSGDDEPCSSTIDEMLAADDRRLCIVNGRLGATRSLPSSAMLPRDEAVKKGSCAPRCWRAICRLAESRK